MSKNVFITGITGFVGTAIAQRLLKQGYNVVGLVKQVNRVSPDLEGCTLVQGDINDYDTIREAISFYETDIIYHLAAFAIVRVAARDPMSAYAVNVMGTVNVLEAARHVGKCSKILVASSDKAYGDHDILPYCENFALQPKNTYDTSKACMDMIARSYAHNYEMPIIVTRCSNVYGPGDYNLSRLIPNTICRGLRGEPAEIYRDIESMKREFIYIDDVVDAYCSLAGLTTQADVYNIGGTGPVSIKELVEEISRLMNISDRPVIKTRDSVFKEIQEQYIDAAKLTAATGWEPKTSLQDGLLKTISWYKERFST